jgi:hypothetical protein
MARRLALATLLWSLLVVPSLAQQSSVDGPVVSGLVMDADSGAVVGDAEVRLSKKTSSVNSPLTGYNSLAVGRTNDAGRFSLGPVSLRSLQPDFPLEDSVSVYYAVAKDGQMLNVRRVDYVSVGERSAQPDGAQLTAGPVTVRLFVSAPPTK